ncbi:C-C motif chemokine 28 [Xiphophorus hellerii]|uniref:C-C motif chemokine 28 n=1 Tax=Xiphophorus hellerii TaxID=8084 RepID=UPI0013B3BFA6|nr:C-C motif chemokine 28 [Xiphophorus hellerii]
MDLKVVLVLAFLSAIAITSTNASIPSCCISTKMITKELLLKVDRWERQYSDGICDIDALVVHIKRRRRPVCVDIQVQAILRRIKRLQQRQAKRNLKCAKQLDHSSIVLHTICFLIVFGLYNPLGFCID